MNLVSEMKAYGKDLLDKKVVEKILISLLTKFDRKVSTIEDTKDLSILTTRELISSLYTFEQRVANRDEDFIENAFQCKINARSQNLGEENNKNKNKILPFMQEE